MMKYKEPNIQFHEHDSAERDILIEESGKSYRERILDNHFVSIYPKPATDVWGFVIDYMMIKSTRGLFMYTL